ncbi:hypothetical protein [Solicola sp. PLA-1-18]|uniref:hypothetical protein n=1 Tax=Solicola sp. PLA-1-18 TaxID=3380532 RepID=UPI003B7BD61B
MPVAHARPLIDVDLPPDFHEVPVASAVEDRVHDQDDLLDRLAVVDPVQREGLGWYLEALSRSAADADVAGTAFCAVRLAGRPSAATVTVAVHDADADDPLVFALGAAESLRADGRYDDVRTERVGHALAALAYGTDPGSGARHVTAVVPAAGHATAVVLCLSTHDTASFGVYDRVLRRAAASVRVVG